MQSLTKTPMHDGDVIDLPQEDTCWIISILQSDEEKDDHRHLYLLIKDKRGHQIGIHDLPLNDVTSWATWYELIVESIRNPQTWLPRRPKMIQLVDPGFDVTGLRQKLCDLGITYPSGAGVSLATPAAGAGMSLATSAAARLTLYRSCSSCCRRGEPRGLLTLCPGCSMMYFCSVTCLETDSFHGEWCPRVAEFGTTEDAISAHPFRYSRTVTDRDFTEEKYRVFLRDSGVLNYGYWRREMTGNFPIMPRFGLLPRQDFPYGLPEEEDVLEQSPGTAPPADSLTSWGAYYKWRHLPEHSIICILLQFPLTIYHILSTHLPHLIQDGDDRTLEIHLLGCEKEADMVPVFEELSHLLPTHLIKLSLIGPSLSKKIHDKTLFKNHRIEIKTYKGHYHKLSLDNPDVAIGLNAGLAAYTSWIKTLGKLRENQTPTVITDYCQLSCALSGRRIREEGLGIISEISVNPFRSPISRFCEEHVMSWFSNAFIYSVNYTATESGDCAR